MAALGKVRRGRLLVEQAAPRDGAERRAAGTARRNPPRSVTVNMLESPLGWLRARGHVSERQYAAGEQLRLDWEQAQLPPCVTMRWDPLPPQRGAAAGAEAGLGGREMRARARFDAAVQAVGPGLRDIVWRVICAGEGMRDAETALGWPARAGKLVLAMALDRLADHYRLP
jgi:hypothetical protein